MLWRLWAKSGCESKPKLPLLPAALLARSRRIERVFAKIKTLLRKVDERTIASVLAWMQLLRAGECGANDGQQIAANPTIGIDSRQVTMSPPTRPAKSVIKSLGVSMVSLLGGIARCSSEDYFDVRAREPAALAPQKPPAPRVNHSVSVLSGVRLKRTFSGNASKPTSSVGSRMVMATASANALLIRQALASASNRSK